MTAFFITSPRRAAGFSLVELMIGLTIGLIAILIITQSLSVFESHKRTTTAGVDAQENGLIALMAIEADIRQAAVGINHPALFSCEKYFSYYQETSGMGSPTVSDSALSEMIPILIQQGTPADVIAVRRGTRITGAAPTKLAMNMKKEPDHFTLTVDRAYGLHGEPLKSGDPNADLILAVKQDFSACSLMGISAVSGSKLTIRNGPSGKKDEYNPPVSYMTSKSWPGYAGDDGYAKDDLVFRVSSAGAKGGIRSVAYAITSDNNLSSTALPAKTVAGGELIASGIVALKAQYGISNAPEKKEITAWVNPSGSTWGKDALESNSTAAIKNRKRIKAIRLAVVARSGQRDGSVVTNICTNQVTNYGPCAWTDDSASSPAPAIDLRTSPGDTGWQHYRYRVYQTVIPLRNVLWPSL